MKKENASTSWQSFILGEHCRISASFCLWRQWKMRQEVNIWLSCSACYDCTIPILHRQALLQFWQVYMSMLGSVGAVTVLICRLRSLWASHRSSLFFSLVWIPILTTSLQLSRSAAMLNGWFTAKCGQFRHLFWYHESRWMPPTFRRQYLAICWSYHGFHQFGY